MSIWDSLFGKKVTIQFRDDTGNLVERKISEAQLKELEASGAISKTQMVEVHVLDPKGNYSTRWEIGKDIAADIVEKAKDPQSDALYALTTYQNGEPQIHVCKKAQWLEAKAKFDAIERGSSDVMASIRKKHPDLFR